MGGLSDVNVPAAFGGPFASMRCSFLYLRHGVWPVLLDFFCIMIPPSFAVVGFLLRWNRGFGTHMAFDGPHDAFPSVSLSLSFSLSVPLHRFWPARSPQTPRVCRRWAPRDPADAPGRFIGRDHSSGTCSSFFPNCHTSVLQGRPTHFSLCYGFIYRHWGKR